MSQSNVSSASRVLAIDYGERRVGLAVNRASLAQPLEVLINDAQLIANIQEVCHQERIELIVMGLSEKEMAQKTRQFATQLEQKLDLPLVFMDETLSSKEVEQRLRAGQAKKSKRSGPIDHFAAAIILDRWLAEHYQM